MDGAMRPPPVPAKRKAAVAPPADEPAPKRIELGDDLPDEVSKEDIQQMLDKADELHVETLNEASLKRMHLQFERKVKVNRELRIKHADDPDKFLKSEVDLDEEIKKFTLVATHPELYGSLLKLETLPLLVGMLNHVNTDIAVDIFEVLSELTDPEVLSEVDEPEVFVKAVFDAQLCQMTVDVLMRIDETVSDEDFKAVTNGLSMIENLADLMPQETCRQFLEIPNFLPWLIKRLRAQGMDYNKVYSSEILGIMLQNSERAREEMVKLEGVDKLLRGIAAYRKRDPADSEEAEYVQNMFDCICSLMLLKANQIAFGNLQGLELMIRMMREKVFAATLALKLVDHSLRHCPENCQIFVEKLGLKASLSLVHESSPTNPNNSSTVWPSRAGPAASAAEEVLFAIFMKKGLEKPTAWQGRRLGPLGRPRDMGEASSMKQGDVQGSVLSLLALSLEGCDEPQTCYPDSSATDTGEYTCVSNRYCSRQDYATQLPAAMSLQACMDECKSRNCKVIQYDCGTHCWLLDNCGSETESGCQSSVYYRDLNWVDTAATTTTSTTTVLGQCFPFTVDSGEYACTATRYCRNQDSGTNTGDGTLNDCLAQCSNDAACVAVQYDCSVSCVLFTDGTTCGDEMQTTCGSSIYYKQSGTTAAQAGGCFPGTQSTGGYACSAAKYCSNQDSALKLGTMPLQDCFSECDTRTGCTGIQYDCNVDCWLLVDVSCGTEFDTSCGSSVYYKQSTTTGPDIAGACFPATLDTGAYTCSGAKYCSNQNSALKLGTMPLQDCFSECDTRTGCTGIQYDCNVDCWLLVDVSCGTEFDTSCGSSVYYKQSTTLSTSQAGTTISGVGGECYPSSTSNGKYTCQAQVYCSNQHDALKLGAMTLQACKAACEEYSNCDAIQYNCNTDCWLLRSCDSYVATTCGSSVYLRSPLGWPVTTTTTTIFGACFPTTEGLYSFNDFTCTPAVYCSNQAEATVYGEAGQITINQCAELCRQIPTCNAIQFDCNTACWLLSSCQSEVTSQCGSSVYRLSGTKAPGQTYALPDGHTWIAYSSSSCTTDDCLVSATCPSNTWPIECLTIPPNTGDGAYQGTYADGLVATGDGRTCEAKGDGAQITLAQATCSDLFETAMENTGAFQEGDLSISCAVGSALSCNCLTAWQVTSVCQGTGTFEPTYSDTSPPKCEINIPVDSVAHRRRAAGAVGATLAATCGKGRYDKAYLWASNQFTNTDTSVEYCGWSSVPYDKITGYGEVDCSGWMTVPSTGPGECADSECLDLADCVKKCSWCGACEAVLYNPDSYVGRPGVRCRMEGSASASLSIVERPPSFEPTMEAVLYVNTRHSNCPKSFNIQRMSFFSDTGCTQLLTPTSLVDFYGQNLSTSWTTPMTYTPSCLPNCVEDEGFFQAVFPETTSVMCAVVHSSTGLAQGWELRLDPQSQVESFGSFDPGLSSLVAGTSFGNSVAFRHVPSSLNLAEESEVTMTGTMHVDCSETITPVVNGCSGFWWKGQLAAALASLLGLPKHMVELQETFRRRLGAEAEHARRLVVWILTYTVTIKIYVDRPHVAAVPNSVQAQLEEMRQSLPLLSSTLMSQIALDPGVTADVGIFSSFSRVDVPPSHLELPPPTTTTTGAPTTVPQTTQAGTGVQTTPTPEDETGVILGLIFGTIGGVVVISYFLYAVMRRRSARARPGAVTPATGATGGAPVSSAGPTAVTIGGKALLRTHSKEELNPLSIDAYNSLPKYWTGPKDAIEVDYHAASREDLTFDELMYVSQGNMRQFQELVTFTYRDIPTQDRLCPTGKHDKTRGGCPCVQPGGDPGLPTDFQVKRVIRVEDSEMFTRYIVRRDKIRQERIEKRGEKCEVPDPPFFTREWMNKHSSDGVLCDLDDELNEVYLWHGTQVRVGLQIAQEDFNLTFAGSGAGTMYGKGLYFTESATKADEYAKDEPGGHYDNVRALLLCRVCVGKFHYTQDREPKAIDKYTAGESDSTLGDRAKSVNTYREIVVYDADQVYPEYLVIYERVHGGVATTPREDLPFLLELPLYWKNVGKNPYTEGFREHWVVKHKIKDLIQRLAEGTCRNPVKVNKVRRVEDSSLWCRYINWKRNLASQLEESDAKIKSPNELDGNPESGHVLTEKILKENHGDEAISVENMQMGLNEMLLWHGTSKKAAETIAEEGFLVASAAHGRRFGNGVYLAEDLTKSLDYCKTDDGIYYVLLCRATCGHIYYTEKDWDSGADGPAKSRGCSCVLANPNQRGPREYILFDVGQVYPEYIVELKRE
ncbi:Beta-catenin-like protein 1 (Nuclear-associated protein) (NAP) [Durusdinium trenchii]|uniref:Poly [ADP-ribose] polymerase n=1 Tax=Durusdinium trenchii TaxID=1381693 RepID=A0ABP0PQK9_9DINO